MTLVVALAVLGYLLAVGIVLYALDRCAAALDVDWGDEATLCAAHFTPEHALTALHLDGEHAGDAWQS